MTGTEWSGAAATQTCFDWTSTSSGVAVGETAGGSVAWTHLIDAPCSLAHRIYCLGKTQPATLTPPVSPGKKIWISNAAFSPNGSTTPDQHCGADQAGARALVARTTVAAASLLTPAATYVRVDGQVVGTGAQLVAAGVLPNGLWQHRNGLYLNFTELVVWTGSNGDLTALGTPTKEYQALDERRQPLRRFRHRRRQGRQVVELQRLVLHRQRPRFLICVEP